MVTFMRMNAMIKIQISDAAEFYVPLIPLRNVCIQLLSLHL